MNALKRRLFLFAIMAAFFGAYYLASLGAHQVDEILFVFTEAIGYGYVLVFTRRFVPFLPLAPRFARITWIGLPLTPVLAIIVVINGWGGIPSTTAALYLVGGYLFMLACAGALLIPDDEESVRTSLES